MGKRRNTRNPNTKPKGRFLLTWNEDKHPEIVEFFNNTKEGMYSHEIRKAIKFYMNYKDTKKEPSKNYENSFTEGFEERKTNYNERDDNSTESDEYTEFDAGELF